MDKNATFPQGIRKEVLPSGLRMPAFLQSPEQEDGALT